jgi:hypothetical protein
VLVRYCVGGSKDKWKRRRSMAQGDDVLSMIRFWSSLLTPVLFMPSATHIDMRVLLRRPPSFIVLIRGSVSNEPAGPNEAILKDGLHEALGKLRSVAASRGAVAIVGAAG